MSYTSTSCPRCGSPLWPDHSGCDRCGMPPLAAQFQQWSAEAHRLEAVDPRAAAQLWSSCLQLVPPHAPAAEFIRQRLAHLGAVLSPYQPPMAAMPPADAEPAGAAGQERPRWGESVRDNDPLPLALFKTGGSMLLSILVYSMFLGWRFATGFTVLILLHELGHVVAMRWYGLKASPPIFIPFLGALINLREQPRNALEEAVVGIGGPVAGALASLACYGWYLASGEPIFGQLAYFGAYMNLFNLLPVPPLDGGRVTAAISPKVWLLGLAGMIGLMVVEFRHGVFSQVMLLVLLFSLPRILSTLRQRRSAGDYYDVPRSATASLALFYLALGGILVGLQYIAGETLQAMMGA